MSEIKIPACAKHLIDILQVNGHDAYVVGGCVRDSFLCKEPNDWDICTSATPDEVCRLMDKYHVRTIETGLQHGTVTACYGVGQYEITTFRVDGEYSDNRRPDNVSFVDCIDIDLSRRDFTINAMAYNDYEGLVDPFGGYTDLCNHRLCCVGHPDDRFREDALRIMRALRFAATYGFYIENNTKAAIHRNKDLLKNISAERIQSELTKMLCGKGILDILLEYKDVMAVIIPELEPCIGFEQNNPYHIYDVYDHIAHAVANYHGDDISIKMALLLHDIGKPECYTEDENGGHFHGHSVPSARIAKDVMERLRFDNKTKNETVDLVLYHDSDIYPGIRSVKRWLNRIGPEMLDQLLKVRDADVKAHSNINKISRLSNILYVRRVMKDIIAKEQCFSLKDLAVNGNDILSLGVDEGPMVGKMLNYLLDQVLDGIAVNEHNSLLAKAQLYLKGD